MGDPIRGKLVWQGTGPKRMRRVIYPTKKGMSQPTPFDADQLAAALRGNVEDEVEVDLELQGGKPVRIRPVGQPFMASAQPQQPPSVERHPAQGRRGQQGERRPMPRDQGRRQEHQPGAAPAFHNPYNFVPALPRDHLPVSSAEQGPPPGLLGDEPPVGHHRYHAHRYSGVIKVKLTVETPLLLPDAAAVSADANDHKSFPVRLGPDGRPYIPPTSIKGMLRAAYEAVTNSRLAVFPGHKDRLADRMPAPAGLALIPARVVFLQSAEAIELLPGNSGISGSGRPVQGDPMYAAWLPRYDRQTGQVASFAVRYPDGSLPQHRDEVQVWLELWERTGQYPFDYWSVRKCVRDGDLLGAQPQPGRARGNHRPVPGVDMISVRGFVCVTNRNIDRKHDERVFFTTRPEPIHHPFTEQLRRQWRELIANYQLIHQAEVASGRTSPPALNNSVWSRQVIGGPNELELSEGALCYAAFNDGTVTALYPVMISRRLFEAAPFALLPAELRPATALSELSPADRVFGWVNQDGNGAYRGNLRVGPVHCDTEDAIVTFGEPGVPLAILGQPKEQQARFYVARNPSGEAQRDGLTKEQAGYCPNEDGTAKALRGRKVYPHHAGLPDDYWQVPQEDQRYRDAATSGRAREYLRHPDARDGQGRPNRFDNQNRSIQGWVKEGTGFTFEMHVTNLSRVELGALLWLLDLDEGHFHRLGGGKPLGFGSVRLEIDQEHTALYDGAGWRQFYQTLDATSPTPIDQQAAIQSFKEAVRSAYGNGREVDQLSFIAAFLKMATGFDRLPIHYPRARQRDSRGQPIPGSVPPNPAGEAFQWFVANERTGGQNPGPQVSLPDLANDLGLPMLDAPRQGG